MNQILNPPLRHEDASAARALIAIVSKAAEEPSAPDRMLEVDDYIFFTLPPTDGTTGPAWLERLRAQGYAIEPNVEAILRSKSFAPTTGRTYHIAAVRSAHWAPGEIRLAAPLAYFIRRRFRMMHPEAVCLMREFFGREDFKSLGITWLAGLHGPETVDGLEMVLDIASDEDADRIGACCAGTNCIFNARGAFCAELPLERYFA